MRERLYGMRDEERPPVLAHQRFQEHRNTFDGLTLQERFIKIHQINLWGAETSVSGLGSEDDATVILRNELPVVFKQFNITSLLDAPCGDASWILKPDLGVRYIGVDIVPAIVESLQQKSFPLQTGFLAADLTCDELPEADAILCRDCLVHFSFTAIHQAIQNFKRSGAEYLITTTFPFWNVNRDIENGDWRALNFQQEPFCWGKPEYLLNEGCTEADGGYPDKSLGVWKLHEVP